jgi:hypothetical protein
VQELSIRIWMPTGDTHAVVCRANGHPPHDELPVRDQRGPQDVGFTPLPALLESPMRLLLAGQRRRPLGLGLIDRAPAVQQLSRARP